MGQTESERLTALETRDEQREKDICEIFSEIRLIKDKLLQRPSWTVTIILTFLSSLSVSLIIILLK